MKREVVPAEIAVNITIENDVVNIDPPTVHVPYGFNGVINWVIQHQDARFKEPPILFEDRTIEVPPATQLKVAQVPWVNDNAAAEPQPYRYTVNLKDGPTRVKHDPTVENDPPGYIRKAQSRA